MNCMSVACDVHMKKSCSPHVGSIGELLRFVFGVLGGVFGVILVSLAWCLPEGLPWNQFACVMEPNVASKWAYLQPRWRPRAPRWANVAAKMPHIGHIYSQVCARIVILSSLLAEFWKHVKQKTKSWKISFPLRRELDFWGCLGYQIQFSLSFLIIFGGLGQQSCLISALWWATCRHLAPTSRQNAASGWLCPFNGAGWLGTLEPGSPSLQRAQVTWSAGMAPWDPAGSVPSTGPGERKPWNSEYIEIYIYLYVLYIRIDINQT